MSNIESTAMYGGGGLIIGFLAGFALKKLFRVVAIILAVVLGLYLASLLYLRQLGVINIDMQKLENMTDQVGSDLIAYTGQVPGMEHNTTNAFEQLGSQVIDALGIAGAGGLFAGFMFGFGVG